MRSDSRIPVGILGATGMVGGKLVRLLRDHPWFELREVGASERSAGRPLGEVWTPDGAGALDSATAAMVLKSTDEEWESPILLSALPSAAAREVEAPLACRGHLVVSNASAHRDDPDVPLVVPEVNPSHLAVLDVQARRWSGGLVTNPNCAVAGLVVALDPLHRAFGLDSVVVTTFQAVSGAGRPGPGAGTVLDNVIPFIGGEEEKFTREPQKILGSYEEGRIEPAPIRVSATCARVPVAHGHLVAVSASFRGEVSPEDAMEAMRAYRGALEHDLPTGRAAPLQLLSEADRPQPLLDRGLGGGMTVTVGRVRRCEVLQLKFFVLSHNLVRGAAGAALLNAELCHAAGRARATSGVGAGAVSGAGADAAAGSGTGAGAGADAPA